MQAPPSGSVREPGYFEDILSRKRNGKGLPSLGSGAFEKVCLDSLHGFGSLFKCAVLSIKYCLRYNDNNDGKTVKIKDKSYRLFDNVNGKEKTGKGCLLSFREYRLLVRVWKEQSNCLLAWVLLLPYSNIDAFLIRKCKRQCLTIAFETRRSSSLQ